MRPAARPDERQRLALRALDVGRAQALRQDAARARGPPHPHQIHSPWTNGNIESFWATLKSEVLDREIFRSLGDAEAALGRFARYYNCHRLHGEIGWLTPAEHYDGTPLTDRGIEHIPALAHLEGWLEDLRAAA